MLEVILLCAATGFYEGRSVMSEAKYSDIGSGYPQVEILSSDAGDFTVDVANRAIRFEPGAGVIGLKISCQPTETKN